MAENDISHSQDVIRTVRGIWMHFLKFGKLTSSGWEIKSPISVGFWLCGLVTKIFLTINISAFKRSCLNEQNLHIYQESFEVDQTLKKCCNSYQAEH